MKYIGFCNECFNKFTYDKKDIKTESRETSLEMGYKEDEELLFVDSPCCGASYYIEFKQIRGE